jgi:tRNA(adenine34) deaminase
MNKKIKPAVYAGFLLFLSMLIHSKYMHEALKQASKCKSSCDVPIGAVITLDGKIIARAHNQVEKNNSAIAHAEILAINKAIKNIGFKRLLDCDLYVTLEPCSMCAGAIVLSRIKRIFYGAPDPKAGAVDSLYSIASDPRLNHRCIIQGGILRDECSKVLKDFFKELRASKNG